MGWDLQIERDQGTVALRLLERGPDRVIRSWRGRIAHEILASRLLPRRLLTPGRHRCDKSTIWHLILAAAAISYRLDHCQASPGGDRSGMLTEWLSRGGIRVTRPRLHIAGALHRGGHPTAHEVFRRLRRGGESCARATVYNTLNLFVERGLIKALLVDHGRIHYDVVTRPHPHVYNVDTGEVHDLAPGNLPALGLPRLPRGCRLEDISVVIRVRQQDRATG